MRQYRIFNDPEGYNAQANPLINEGVAKELKDLGHRVQYREVSEWRDID